MFSGQLADFYIGANNTLKILQECRVFNNFPNVRFVVIGKIVVLTFLAK